MALNATELSPYISFIACRSTSTNSNDQTNALANVIKSILNTANVTFKTVQQDPARVNTANATNVVVEHYVEVKQVSWSTERIVDKVNQYFIVVRRDQHFAIFLSDTTKKIKIRAKINETTGVWQNFSLVTEGVLNKAFLGDATLKSLWMNGIHRSTAVKADSKVLSGSDLVSALDPLGDQTYAMSAAKGVFGPAGQRKPIGVNPSRASVWKRPSKNWDDFKNTVTGLLEKIGQVTEELENPVPILAKPKKTFDGLSEPFDVAIASLSTFADQDAIQGSIRDALEEFESNFDLELIENESTERKLVLNCLKRDGGGNRFLFISKITTNLSFDTNKGLLITATGVLAQGAEEDDQKKVLSILKDKRLLKVWYESGHSISEGNIYEIKHRNLNFDGFSWGNFTNYNVAKEKPDNLVIAQMGNEDSLFSWVKNHWDGVNFPVQNTQPAGWLACDDGPGEKADFIHITNPDADGIKTLSLIHVKAAKKSNLRRNISVGAHDIVVNQAIKNLRYLDRKALGPDIHKPAQAQVRDMVWHNGNQVARNGFIREIDSLGTNYKRRVVVIQPHTIQRIYEAGGSVNKRKQLVTLLNSAKASINSLGVEFLVIGAQ
jgi:hypothetical protein